MSLRDYNIPPEDEEKLKKRCKNLDRQDRLILFECAISTAPGLEIAVYDSIISKRKGYTLLDKKESLPVKKPDDFYALRRKTMAEFYNRLRLYHRWK